MHVGQPAQQQPHLFLRQRPTLLANVLAADDLPLGLQPSLHHGLPPVGNIPIQAAGIERIVPGRPHKGAELLGNRWNVLARIQQGKRMLTLHKMGRHRRKLGGTIQGGQQDACSCFSTGWLALLFDVPLDEILHQLAHPVLVVNGLLHNRLFACLLLFCRVYPGLLRCARAVPLPDCFVQGHIWPGAQLYLLQPGCALVPIGPGLALFVGQQPQPREPLDCHVLAITEQLCCPRVKHHSPPHYGNLPNTER